MRTFEMSEASSLHQRWRIRLKSFVAKGGFESDTSEASFGMPTSMSLPENMTNPSAKQSHSEGTFPKGLGRKPNLVTD